MESLLKNAHRVVVKVGSALVTNDGRGLDIQAIERWATQIAELQKMGREVILVSSGAIAEGVLRLGWEKRPSHVHQLQAAAAVGQMGLVEADVLVILTDQQGLYTADPRKDPEAMFVSVATAGDPVLEKMAGGAASSLSKGGMITKILAAKRAARSGAGTIIASGRETDVLTRLARGELIGTHLRPSSTVLHARKQWIADHLRASGSLVLDEGAAKALVAKHTSLLPVGVIGVKGEFVRGEVVSCLTEDGCEIARGLVNYSSDDASRILRAHTEEIEERLGYMEQPEMIHRDNMVVLAGE